jgi:hypothetical protein
VGQIFALGFGLRRELERLLKHPAVVAISNAARNQIFGID